MGRSDSKEGEPSRQGQGRSGNDQVRAVTLPDHGDQGLCLWFALWTDDCHLFDFTESKISRRKPAGKRGGVTRRKLCHQGEGAFPSEASSPPAR